MAKIMIDTEVRASEEIKISKVCKELSKATLKDAISLFALPFSAYNQLEMIL